jgi:hypothetical protein
MNMKPPIQNGVVSSNGAIEPFNPVTGELGPRDAYALAMGGGRGALAVGASQALAAAAERQAVVKAQYEMARTFPRDWNVTRQKLLADCARFEFADEAIYSKPVAGKKMEGLSIRFAEAASRTAGNIKVTRRQVEDDRFWSRYLLTVEDLESQTISEEELTVAKTVERKVPGDRQVVSERTNSNGERVYVCIATEDELRTKVKAESQKVKRQLLLELLPADLKADCERAIYAARAKGAASGDARKLLVDAFFSVGVRVQDLQDYLGHTVDTVQPAELVELRSVYNALKDGETTWAEVLETRPERGAGAAPQSNVPSPSGAESRAGDGDPVDALLADIAAAPDIKSIDALMARVRKIAPQHPRRGDVAAALENRKKVLAAQKTPGPV